MDGIGTLHVELFHTVDGLADHVQHAALDLVARRHHDGRTHGDGFKTALQSVGIVHSHAANGVFTDVLLHLYNQVAAVGTGDSQSIMDFWQHFLRLQSLSIEINVDHGTDNLGNASFNLCHNSIIVLS